MRAHRLTRREFLSAAGALPVAAALPRLGHAAARPITLSHSISTVVYAQHLVAREKRFLRGGGHQVMRTVIVPSALAWTFASLTPSVSFALIGVVIGEFIGGESGGGIGYLIIARSGTSTPPT